MQRGVRARRPWVSRLRSRYLKEENWLLTILPWSVAEGSSSGSIQLPSYQATCFVGRIHLAVARVAISHISRRPYKVEHGGL